MGKRSAPTSFALARQRMRPRAGHARRPRLTGLAPLASRIPGAVRDCRGGTLDYRGVFLRCRGGNAAPLGQLQGDAIRNITAQFVCGETGHGSQRAAGAVTFAGRAGMQDGTGWPQSFYQFDVSRVVGRCEQSTEPVGGLPYPLSLDSTSSPAGALAPPDKYASLSPSPQTDSSYGRHTPQGLKPCRTASSLDGNSMMQLGHW